MIDTAALKNNILESAFKGELVSSVECGGCISDLINCIPNPSNKRLGLLKKGSDTVFPYDLPDNWEVVPLGKITSYGDTPTKIMASDVDGDTWILELEDIEAGGRLLKKTRVASRKAIGEKTTFNRGQILYSKLRPYLKKVLQADENGICTPELIAFDVYAGINPRYVMYYLTCNFVDKVINQRSYGVKMPRVDAQFMVNLPVPLPTIAVQNKIVDIIDAAFSTVDIINELQVRYSSNLEVLKSKIIDAGIHGKLTEQLPEDGTAEELLKQIRNKKDRMINEGLIPKESVSKKIGNEDMNFEILQNWAYARVQDVATYITDYVANGSFATLKANTKTYKEPNYAVFVRTLDLGAQFCNELSYIDEASYEFLRKSKLYGGELILPNIGASIGKAFIMPDLGMPMSLAPNSVMVKFENNIMNKYFYYVFQSSYGKGILMNIQGGAATPKFSKTDLRKMIVMLPPLAEQERIVNRIEEIFALIQ